MNSEAFPPDQLTVLEKQFKLFSALVNYKHDVITDLLHC